jgi:hypothetical protein
VQKSPQFAKGQRCSSFALFRKSALVGVGLSVRLG